MASARRSRSFIRVPPLGRELADTEPSLRHRELLHDVQPQADAAEPAAVTGLALHEPLKDPLVIARRDADALVIDRDLDPLP